MTVTRKNEKLKGFIKNTLGCGCPDKVFEKIDVSKHRDAGYEKEISRVVVGDTLLIYFMSIELSGDCVDRVESIGFDGKDDRDTNNYNRFRLVVSGLDDDARQREVSARFSDLFASDTKMHIHFVSQELVDSLS